MTSRVQPHARPTLTLSLTVGPLKVPSNETIIQQNEIGQKFIPVYTSVSIDRLLSVDPRLGQVELNFQVITSWNDTSAKATVWNSTQAFWEQRFGRCFKPCNDVEEMLLCCNEVFTIGLHFANAVGQPTVLHNVLFGDDGAVTQITQVSGTFFQSFNLKYYPYSRMQVVVGMRLNSAQFSGKDVVAVLPVPIGITIQNGDLGDGSAGWYTSSPILLGNNPYFQRVVTYQNVSEVANAIGTDATRIVDLQGVNITAGDKLISKMETNQTITQLGYTASEVSASFKVELGGIESFVMTLPLALLALLNCLVFVVPLRGGNEAFKRFELSTIMFFTNSMVIGQAALGGSNNQLNALQQLSIVVFSCLVFTVFASMVLESLREYRLVGYALRNHRQVLKGCQADILCQERIKGLETDMEKHCEALASDMKIRRKVHTHSSGGQGGSSESGRLCPTNSTPVSCEEGRPDENTTEGSDTAPAVARHALTFRQRFRFDKAYRYAVISLLDRVCWLTVIIVYVTTFITIPLVAHDQTALLEPFGGRMGTFGGEEPAQQAFGPNIFVRNTLFP